MRATWRKISARDAFFPVIQLSDMLTTAPTVETAKETGNYTTARTFYGPIRYPYECLAYVC